MIIKLSGRIPSKKNSKQIVCRGKFPRVLPSKEYTKWHAGAMDELAKQRVPQNKIQNYDVHVWFYAPDKRRADSSNKLESIMDLLVDYGHLADDSWWNTEEIVIHKVELDKDNPGAEIEITPI